MFKLSTFVFKRLTPLRTFRGYSSSVQAVKESVEKTAGEDIIPGREPITHDAAASAANIPKTGGLVAAAFASIQSDVETAPLRKSNLQKSDFSKPKQSSNQLELKQHIEGLITKANDVKSLLVISDSEGFNRRHAIRIVSTLAGWTANKKVTLAEFELDPRFLRICRLLGRQRSEGAVKASDHRGSEDLSTVLGVTGDDEAARLIASLNLPQMVKVMSTLAQKKRRSTPLLRALAFNITRIGETIDLKRSADLLYAMSTLNFPDPVLMDRVCSDIQEKLPENSDRSSIAGSVATSLGFLRYKDTEMLDALSEWMVTHSAICRPADTAALCITLATLGYTPANIDSFPKLSQLEITKPSTWLDYVWSLTILNKVTKEQISTVLSPEFIDSLQVEEIPLPVCKKLLNINAYAQQVMQEYNGPLLSDKVEQKNMSYSKEKFQFVSSVLFTLKSLLSSEEYLQKNCDSKMGFLFDAECVLDEKCNPFPVKTDVNKSDKRLYKVAILALDYHDICRQIAEPVGAIMLYKTLLESRGYRVMTIPYTEFNPNDKPVARVQYIEKKLKELVASPGSPL